MMEGMHVTLRKWFHLFWTTLLLGMIVSIGIGLILQFSDKEFSVMGLSAVGFNVLNMLLGERRLASSVKWAFRLFDCQIYCRGDY